MSSSIPSLLLLLALALTLAPTQAIQHTMDPSLMPVKAGCFLDDFVCRLDPRINAETLVSFRNGTYLEQIQQYMWATACGRSRGVFYLDDYPGETFSCANWPADWNIDTPADFFADPSQYEEHIGYLDLYLQGNYNTTAVHAPGTCDFSSFTLGDCGEDRRNPSQKTAWADRLDGKPFRGVNVGGIFVLEPWITPNFTKWTLEITDQITYDEANPVGTPGYKTLVDHWNNWYTNEDFAQMKAAGLNSVRVPVGWWYWAKQANISPEPYALPEQDINDIDHPITRVIKMASDNGLLVVLDLHGAPGSQNGLDNSGQRSQDPRPERWGYNWSYNKENQKATTEILVEMAKWIQHIESAHGLDNIVLLELLNEIWVFSDMSIARDWYKVTIEAIREVSKISLLIGDCFRHQEWDWLLIDFPFENIYLDTHIYHAFNPDDIASSEPKCDKNKMIVAENIACGYGSMLRFKTCTSLPTLVGEWSLAVDDCIGLIRGAESSIQFKDFGQCKNLVERVGDDEFWTEHYRKFFTKQASMAEREIGWFFWTWKTGPGSEHDPSVAYWSYSAGLNAGTIPNPLEDQEIEEACYVFESTEPYTC